MLDLAEDVPMYGEDDILLLVAQKMEGQDMLIGKEKLKKGGCLSSSWPYPSSEVSVLSVRGAHGAFGPKKSGGLC